MESYLKSQLRELQDFTAVLLHEHWLKCVVQLMIRDIALFCLQEIKCIIIIIITTIIIAEVAQWLRYCATNRKVAGSIPDGVIGFFR
jgi:hypothetical protein